MCTIECSVAYTVQHTYKHFTHVYTASSLGDIPTSFAPKRESNRNGGHSINVVLFNSTPKAVLCFFLEKLPYCFANQQGFDFNLGKLQSEKKLYGRAPTSSRKFASHVALQFFASRQMHALNAWLEKKIFYRFFCFCFNGARTGDGFIASNCIARTFQNNWSRLAMPTTIVYRWLGSVPNTDKATQWTICQLMVSACMARTHPWTRVSSMCPTEMACCISQPVCVCRLALNACYCVSMRRSRSVYTACEYESLCDAHHKCVCCSYPAHYKVADEMFVLCDTIHCNRKRLLCAVMICVPIMSIQEITTLSSLPCLCLK